jgi:hypothetical protein
LVKHFNAFQHHPIMSKRKGVSAQEKRDRLLTMLRDSKRPWSTKEVEKSAKSLGFHAMAMPDVLNSLLDDSLVEKEKIGSANYVWSFPSDAYKRAKLKHDTYTSEVEALTAELTENEEKKRELEEGREETTEYVQMYEELKTKKQELGELEKAAVANSANDPEALGKLSNLVEQMRQNINRVTENTFELFTYLTKKKGFDRTMVKDFLKMSDSFDEV